MKIRYETSGDKKIVYIEGEINSANAETLENSIYENVSMSDKLIMDFSGVKYISSAGLRVLLKAQKTMSKLGSLALRGINEPVMEILKIVKLDKILKIEGADAQMAGEAETKYDIDEYTLTEEEADLLPLRVRHLYDEEKLIAFSADRDGKHLGFAVIELSKDESMGYIFYLYVREEERGKGVATGLVQYIQDYLEDIDIRDIFLVSLNSVDVSKFAGNMGFKNANRTRFILQYNKKQILSSPIWKQMDKLRTMYDEVKIYDELDYLEQMQLNQLIGHDDFEDIDHLYARIYSENGKVTGFLNACMIADNNIWITQVRILPSKLANQIPILMFASLLDAVMLLWNDDDMIQVVLSDKKMIESFEQILGQPMATLKDVIYKKI